jgi:hypothetical protein
MELLKKGETIMEMKNKFLSFSASVFLCGGVFIGCGGGSSATTADTGTPSGDTTGGTTVEVYSGDRTLSGSVENSSLVRTASTTTTSSSIFRSLRDVSPTEVVKLDLMKNLGA